MEFRRLELSQAGQYNYAKHRQSPYLKHAGMPGQYYRQRSTPGQPL